MKIEMSPSTRNYLVRLLENYKNGLKYTNMPKTGMEHELEMIRIANDSLMGKKEKISLDKNQSPINFRGD